MGQTYHLVLCTVPDRETGKKIALRLVEQKLAACCNIVPGIFSVYRWKGNIEQDDEELLLIKSSPSLFPQLKQAIFELHPYDVPEIIALPITDGAQEYLEWMDQNLEVTDERRS